MKKFLFVLSCCLIISLFSSAKEWNISSDAFKALGNITATTTIDGLTIYAAADKAVAVDESAKAINGIDFTHRLKLGGAGTLNANVPVSRVLSFDVTGPLTISIALQSSSSSADRELCLVSSVTGDTLHIFPAPGAAASWAEYSYTGGAQSLYLLSKSAGINIYYLKTEAQVVNDPITIQPAKTIFDPATVDPSTLNSGFEIVKIDGESYLKVTLAGWGSWTAIPQVVLNGVTKFKCKAKFEAGTSGLAASTVNTFIKLVNPSWGEVGAKGAVSTDAFSEYTVPVTTPATVAILQIAGQSNVNWSAISGGIIYIGKIEAIDGTAAPVDTKFSNSNPTGTELVKGGNMEDASAWTFYYNVADAKDTNGSIEFNYTADKPAAGEGGCYKVNTYGQSATFLYQKIKMTPGHTYRFDGAFKNASDSTANVWLEYGIMKEEPEGEIATSEFSYVFNLNTWMGADTLDVDTTFGEYFPFSGSNSNTFKLPDSETDTEWFVVIKTGCWNTLGDVNSAYTFLFDDVSVVDLTPNVVKGGNMEDPSAWTFYYNTKDAKDSLGTIQFNYTEDGPAAGEGGCYRVTTYGQSATFLYQPITLIPGHRYTFGGAFKNASDSTANTWLEYGIMRNQPTGGEIATSDFSWVYNLNTWMGADTLDVDTTFEEYFPFSGSETNVFTVPEDEADNQWFIVIKTGCWNALGDANPTYTFLFDDIAVYDVSYANTGGNMEDASAWKFYYNVADAKDISGVTQFNYTEDTPAAGKGGCYRVSTYGQSATFTYQPVDIIPGHRYQLTGAFKNASDSTANTWLEFGVMRNEPGGGEVATGEFSFVYNLNTWMGADTLNVDTTFPAYFPFTGGANGTFVVPDTVTDTKWFILIKTGCWNELGITNPTFDFLFDEVYLIDLGLEPWITLPIAKTIVGTVTDATDFAGSVRMKWDTDNVYMEYSITDDVIVTTGNPWDCDNIEIYFDTDNSKNVHWPRNGGWMANDPTYDANDFQLRLVPGKEWSANNTAVTGVTQVYSATATGYEFAVTIPWASLTSFVAEAPKTIGFDVLASDNDDNFRNQITWNSPTDKAFNDPSLWGTLQLTPSGSFVILSDTEKPSAPSNLVASALGNSSALLTWDPATDNVAVMSYIVYDKVTVVDTIYAAATGNKFTFTNLKDGDHKFGVVAVDNYGNKSSKVQSDNVSIKVSNKEFANASFSVYPNPTNGLVNIEAIDNNETHMVVYNVAGVQINKGTFVGKHTLDMTSVQKGVYFIKLSSNDKSEISKLVVK